MDWTAIGAVATALSALFALGAAIAAALSARQSKIAAEAARRIVDIEERRDQERRMAALVAKIDVELNSIHKTHGHYNLLVRNEGPARAEDVRVWLGNNLNEPRHEAQRVEVGSATSANLSSGRDGNHPYRVRVTWKDGRGPDQYGALRTFTTSGE